MIRTVLLSCLLPLFASGAAVPVLDSYYSPRNAERPLRKATSFIILHTTEGASKGALSKLSQRGEAHYLVDEVGRIFRIIDQRRVALHAGRSMWNGRTSLDACSIGIEIAGYHNREISTAQYRALKALIEELQRVYRVPDERVLTHSMVAYGAPNQWQSHNHRGRKRCGMRFAMSSVRLRLGLSSKPRSDPDVAARRLVVADPYLARVLYGGSAQEQEKAAASYVAAAGNVIGPGRSAWDVARDAYNSADTFYVFPDGTRRSGRQITDWRNIPRGTRVMVAEGDSNPEEPARTIGVDAPTATAATGAEGRSRSTLYVTRDGRCLRGDEVSEAALAAMPVGTRVLVGYKVDGPITARRRAFDICGPNWQAPDTYFLFPDGKLAAGNEVDANRIPKQTMVLYKN